MKMMDIRYMLILVVCVCAVHCALPRPSCTSDSDCSSDEKCVYQSNSNPVEYTLCSPYNSCSCKKVCLYKNRYVTSYYDGCNTCGCGKPELNLFMCTMMACPDLDKLAWRRRQA